MKKTFFIILFLAIVGIAKAQNSKKDSGYSITKIDTTIYSIIELTPTFPGGKNKLNEYFNKYFKVLHGPDFNGGTVIVQCIVEKDGSLSNLKIRKSSNKNADEMAINILHNCPKWNPGMQQGIPVRISFIIPITFATND